MNKNWRSSLKKWDAGLWNRLNNQLKKHPKRRNCIFCGYLWHACGFCYEFIPCNNCPLFKDKRTCHSSFVMMSPNSPIRTMRTAWDGDNRRSFEKARQEFYNIMKSHRDKFKKEPEP